MGHCMFKYVNTCDFNKHCERGLLAVGYRRSYIKEHLGQYGKIFQKSRLIYAPHKYNIAVEKANTLHIYFEVEFQYRTKTISLGLYCVCQHLMQISYRSFSFKTTQYGLQVLPKTAEGVGGGLESLGKSVPQTSAQHPPLPCKTSSCPVESRTSMNYSIHHLLGKLSYTLEL